MNSLDELKYLREEAIKKVEVRNGYKDARVVVGMATCGISAGARHVLSAFMEEVANRNLEKVQVVKAGCIGMCTLEPIVEIYTPGKEKVTYIHVDPDKVRRIVAEHLINGSVIKEYTIGAAE